MIFPSHSHPALGVCRENPISPCKLSELRVSVLKLLRKTIHHGDTEDTERVFSDRLLAVPQRQISTSCRSCITLDVGAEFRRARKKLDRAFTDWENGS